MTQQLVTLQIPQEIYERAREIGEASDLSAEQVLLDGLTTLYGDLPKDLSEEAITHLSDEQLWALVKRPFAIAQRMRMRELTALGKAGQLSESGQVELEELLDELDEYTLQRTTALVTLKERGHEVEKLSGHGAKATVLNLA
ncbi:MAG: hypothetical protein F9K46_16735 [Anaerolineae bacterium]|nr:MAG: hypothetical protein F9K46_16735 [Anaerolineae bacterium]